MGWRYFATAVLCSVACPGLVAAQSVDGPSAGVDDAPAPSSSSAADSGDAASSNASFDAGATPITPEALRAALMRLAEEHELEDLPIQVELIGDRVTLSITSAGVIERYIIAVSTFVEWVDAEFTRRRNRPQLMNWNGELLRVRRRRREMLAWNAQRLGAEGLDSPRR